MSDFDHIHWRSVLSDASLQPLNDAERRMIDALLVPGAAVQTVVLAEHGALGRLESFDLAEYDDDGWVATDVLIAANERGLLNQLLEIR